MASNRLSRPAAFTVGPSEYTANDAMPNDTASRELDRETGQDRGQRDAHDAR